MATICGTLAAANETTRDCDNLPIGGVADEIIVLNYADLLLCKAGGATKWAVNSTLKEIIETFVLTTGKEGFVFESAFQQIKPKVDSVKKASGTKFKQSITFQVPLNTGQGDDTLKKLANGEFAVVLVNKWKGAAGAGKYKVYGVDGGLRMAASTVIDPWADTEGVTTVTLESQDASLENYPQYTIYKTDEATTDAIYTALKTAAS